MKTVRFVEGLMDSDHTQFIGQTDGHELKIGIVVSRFNQYVTSRMLSTALEALSKLQVPKTNITIVHVPGAFELPGAARKLAGMSDIDSVICLGVIIRGDTAHFEYISYAASIGIERAAADTGKPVIFGVLTTYNAQQAVERIAQSGDYALAAVEMGNLTRQLLTGEPDNTEHN